MGNKKEYDAWSGSHHDLAMQLVSPDTVLGNFDNAVFDYHGVISTFYTRAGDYYVNTDGPVSKAIEYGNKLLKLFPDDQSLQKFIEQLQQLR